MFPKSLNGRVAERLTAAVALQGRQVDGPAPPDPAPAGHPDGVGGAPEATPWQKDGGPSSIDADKQRNVKLGEKLCLVLVLPSARVA